MANPQIDLGVRIVELRTLCTCCGATLAPWFDDLEQLLQLEECPAYQTWLDTACGACGVTPRQAVTVH